MSLCSLSRRGRLRSSGWLGEGNSIPEMDDLVTEPDPTLPSTEDVIRKTEQITKNIQELLRAAQENKHDRSEQNHKRKGSLIVVYFPASILSTKILLHSSLFCYVKLGSSSSISPFSFVHCLSSTLLYFPTSAFAVIVVLVSLNAAPPPHPPIPSPSEQTVRRCAAAQAQPGMFQHSGALGREGPPFPPCAQPAVPWPRLLVLWPLSLPPRHSFISLSLHTC